jgi:hypothetical protein
VLAIQHARTLGIHSAAIIADIERGPAPQAPQGAIGQEFRGGVYNAEPIANDPLSMDAFDRARGQAHARNMLGSASAPGAIWAGVPAALASRAAPGAERGPAASGAGGNLVHNDDHHALEDRGGHAAHPPDDSDRRGTEGELLLDFNEGDTEPFQREVA